MKPKRIGGIYSEPIFTYRGFKFKKASNNRLAVIKRRIDKKLSKRHK